MLQTLQEAKKHSDQGQYSAKGALMFSAMMERPGEFVLDQQDGSGHPGVTHLPTGFQMHLPRKYIPAAVIENTSTAMDLLEEADQDQWLKGRVHWDAPIHRRVWEYNDDGRLAGFAMVRPGVKSKKQISGVFVGKDHRRKGLARKIVNRVLDEHGDVEAFVEDGNIPSGTLFEREGFDKEPVANGMLYRKMNTKAAAAPSDQEITAATELSPSEAQSEAGNYRKAKFTLHGLDISIETPKGALRSGVSRSGKRWSTEMHAHYGYIRGSEACDGDHLDCFIGPDTDSEKVWVIDQVSPDSGEFDEPKVILGYSSESAAREGYLANYEKGWKGLGKITKSSPADIRLWVDLDCVPHQFSKFKAEYDGGWLGVDLDGTLAKSYDGEFSPDNIGDPNPPVLRKVKRWLSDGRDVRVFTARAADAKNIPAVEAWCEKHLGRKLPVTNEKDPSCRAILDDRARMVKQAYSRAYKDQEELDASNVPEDIWFYVDATGDRATCSVGDWHEEEEWDAAMAFGKKHFSKWEEPDDTEIGRPGWAACEFHANHVKEAAQHPNPFVQHLNSAKSGSALEASPHVGAQGMAQALQEMDLDKVEAVQREIIRKGPKSKREKAIQTLAVIQGLRRNELSPKDLMISQVPVIPPQFRPFAAQGGTFIPGDANVLYKELMDMREAYQNESQVLGWDGAAGTRRNLYSAVKAVYGYGDPVNEKSQRKGVSGFMQKVLGKGGPKYCYDDETEILTLDGWVLFKELPEGVPVATINPETRAFEWQIPHAYTHDFYEGEMLHYLLGVRGGVDLMVTPTHRMAVRFRGSKKKACDINTMRRGWEIVEAEKLAQSASRFFTQTAAPSWTGGKDVLPAPAQALDPLVFAEFLGWWLAEDSNHICGTIVYVPQTDANPTYVKDLRVLWDSLHAAGLDTAVHTRETPERTVHSFVIRSASTLVDWLNEFCGVGAANKRIPVVVKNWSAPMLRTLLHAYLCGDGAKRAPYTRKTTDCPTYKNRSSLTDVHHSFNTVSSRLYDDLTEVCFKLGITVRPGKYDPLWWEKQAARRGVPSSNYQHVYVGHLVGKWWLGFEKHRGAVATPVHYRGMVHCCSVDNGLLVVRRNKRIAVSGNSYLARRMLGKTQDSVARGTIIIDPELGLDEIAIPEEMGWTMYAPYVQRRLVLSGMSPGDALRSIRERTAQAHKARELEAENRWIVYSRAPVWHKWGIISAKPKFIEGSGIAVNPWMTTGANADFDGDAVNLHLPSTDSAVREAREVLPLSKMLLKTRNPEEVMPSPKQEQVLGLWTAQHRAAANRHTFGSEDEALAAIRSGKVSLSDEVEIAGLTDLTEPVSIKP